MYDSIQPLQLIKSLPGLSIAFLNPHTGAWDEELVRATFWQEDAEVILNIPVHEGMEDTIAWHYNKNGIFFHRDQLIKFILRTEEGSMQLEVAVLLSRVAITVTNCGRSSGSQCPCS